MSRGSLPNRTTRPWRRAFHHAAHEPIRSAIASAIASGEFRTNDADFLAWAFLVLISGLIEVGGFSSEPPVALADVRGEQIANPMIDLFLEGARSRALVILR